MTADADRRPIAARKSRWVQALAAGLARRRVSPNAISIASVAFAAIGAAAFTVVPLTTCPTRRALLFAAAALAIQLRLLCNLIDGLVAVEGGLRTHSGDVFNDLPDRVADVLLLVGAGYAARELPHGVELGWLASALALLCAYVRVLGKSVGAGMHYLGPMAKQHRMAALTLACLLAAGLGWRGQGSQALAAGLALIAAGCVVTLVRRTRHLLRLLSGP